MINECRPLLPGMCLDSPESPTFCIGIFSAYSSFRPRPHEPGMQSSRPNLPVFSCVLCVYCMQPSSMAQSLTLLYPKTSVPVYHIKLTVNNERNQNIHTLNPRQ